MNRWSSINSLDFVTVHWISLIKVGSFCQQRPMSNGYKVLWMVSLHRDATCSNGTRWKLHIPSLLHYHAINQLSLQLGVPNWIPLVTEVSKVLLCSYKLLIWYTCTSIIKLISIVLKLSSLSQMRNVAIKVQNAPKTLIPTINSIPIIYIIYRIYIYI